MPLPHWFATLAPGPTPLVAIRRFLREQGRTDTLRHCSRVAAVGRKLARRWGVPLAHSDLACLAHDLAAVVPLREIIECAEQLDVCLSNEDRAIPQVVHGPVAAAVLRRALGVSDPDVLNAVHHHTTLRAGASPLEQLVFIADKIEYDPTTRHIGYHAALMDAMYADASLPALCCIYLDWAVQHGPGLGWRLHPNLLAAHTELKDLSTKGHEVKDLSWCCFVCLRG